MRIEYSITLLLLNSLSSFSFKFPSLHVFYCSTYLILGLVHSRDKDDLCNEEINAKVDMNIVTGVPKRPAKSQTERRKHLTRTFMRVRTHE